MLTAPNALSTPKCRVLLCEDEGLILMQMRKILHSAGYEVVGEASTDRDAVALALACEVDLILMDLHLAAGSSGMTAVREILGHHFVPIILLTGTANASLIQAALDVGVCSYLVKPITHEQLLPVIASVLSRFPPGPRTEQTPPSEG